MSGEAGDASVEAVSANSPFLLNLISQFDVNDVWNYDEFRLFYNMSPSKVIAHMQLVSRKKNKARTSCSARANATRSLKSEIAIIHDLTNPGRDSIKEMFAGCHNQETQNFSSPRNPNF